MDFHNDIMPLICIIIGMIPILLLFVRKAKHNCLDDIRFIKPFLWLMFIGSIYEQVFTGILRIPSSYWFTFYTLLEFLVLCVVFNRLFNSKYTGIFKTSSILYTCAWIAALFFWSKENHYKIESYFVVAETVLVYCFSMLWFKDILKRTEFSLVESPGFYFIIGFLIYFLGSFFAYMLIHEVVKTKLFIILSHAGLIFNIIMRILFVIGVWKATKTKNLFVKVR